MKNLYASVAALGLTAGAITFGIPAEAQQASDAQGQQAGAEAGAQTEAQAGAETGQADLLIVTVGDREIRQSDVVEAIEALPPQVRQTPPQMLFPAVVDQLITRGLMVERARAENLHEDPEVRAMIEPGAEALEEQALVDVWLRREIGERVTGEDVEKTIEALRATNPDLAATPGLVPQVTQALQVKAMEDISAELRQDAEITFYGPGGEPVDTEAQVSAGFEQGTAPASEPALAADEAPASQPALAADESTEMAAAETGGMEPDTEDLAAYGIKVATSDQFGEYLVSEDGKPLYMFTPDTQGTGGRRATATRTAPTPGRRCWSMRSWPRARRRPNSPAPSSAETARSRRPTTAGRSTTSCRTSRTSRRRGRTNTASAASGTCSGRTARRWKAELTVFV